VRVADGSSVRDDSGEHQNGHIESLNPTLARELLNFKGTSNNIRVYRANFKQFISDYHAVRLHKALELKSPTHE